MIAFLLLLIGPLFDVGHAPQRDLRGWVYKGQVEAKDIKAARKVAAKVFPLKHGRKGLMVRPAVDAGNNFDRIEIREEP